MQEKGWRRPGWREAWDTREMHTRGQFLLLEKRKENNLSPHDEKEPYQVMARHGDQIQLKWPQGVEYKRNIQHAKQFVTPVI